VFKREKTVMKHSFGNLNENSIMDIWNSNEYSKFRDIVHNNQYPSCIDCDLVDGCDLVKDTITDCYTAAPSCADCL
jgi:MoaA/NifB/PqqE/SkfB family radical SAM enzyme